MADDSATRLASWLTYENRMLFMIQRALKFFNIDIRGRQVIIL